MDEERNVLNEAIQNAFNGTLQNNLGTQERKDAADELKEFYRLKTDEFKAKDNSDLERAKLEAEKARLEAEKEKAKNNLDFEREKLNAEKEKAERDAKIEKEKIKADDRKDKRNVVVKVIQLFGVAALAGLALITDSENWLGRPNNKVASWLWNKTKL